MTDYLTHPLNKRARPNLTDMFDNGRLNKYTETGSFEPATYIARAVLPEQTFRRIMNKANAGSENA